jgi:hypothetical protein
MYLVMKARYKILPASVIAAVCMGCHRQVYSLHVVGGKAGTEITWEYNWQIEVASHNYGLEQYSYLVDAEGRAIVGLDHESHSRELGVTRRTFTNIYLGGRPFTVRAHAWSVVVSVVFALVLTLWLVLAAWNGILKKGRPESDK